MIKDKTFQKHFIRTLLILVSTTTIFLFIFVKIFHAFKMQEIKTEQTSVLKLKKESAERVLKEALIDLIVISESEYFLNQFNQLHHNQTIDSQSIGIFKKLFIYKGYYNQMRFLDCKGKEVFRMNKVGKEPQLVPFGELQDKSNRYYFTETAKLSHGEVYISPLDLNIENGKIEQPQRPMIRLCMPMFNSDSTMAGVSIINYEASLILNDFHQNIQGELGDLFMINKDGYFLHHPDTSMEWGFMFEEKNDLKFDNIFQNDFEYIQLNGQFEVNGNLYTTATINPLAFLERENLVNKSDNEYYWRVISYIPKEKISFWSLVPFNIVFYPWLMVYLSAFLITWYYSVNLFKKIKAQEELAESENNLRKSNDDKSLFISILTHDLKGSLSGMNAFVSYLIESFSESSKIEILKSLEGIQRNSKNQLKLLEDILLWAGIQMGIVAYKPGVVNVKELFLEIKELSELMLNDKKLTLKVAIENDTSVIADVNMMKTVFRNLLSNAIKFSHENGIINVSCIRTDNMVEINVQDQGVGIDTELINKQFDITKRTHKAGTKNEGGSGFGLKMVNSLVVKNKGRIKVSSEIGKGSIFTVILPA